MKNFICLLILFALHLTASGNTLHTPLSKITTDTIPDSTSQGDYMGYPALLTFMERMQSTHSFGKAYLQNIFSPVKRDKRILEKVNNPAEGLLWKDYRQIFLTENRIDNGVDFWIANDSTLARAENEYGVAAKYIVAILGVETAYGRNTGSFKVLQSLTTLAMDYPKRSRFYLRELEEFLLLAREENLPADTLKGSYAGAMGMAQFIASSYRFYAVDFNNDGQRNLWQPADAIASVANYLARHGWQAGQPVAAAAETTGNQFYTMTDTVARKPRYTLGQFALAGAKPASNFTASTVNLIKLTGTDNTEYWFTATNFYVITRYNHSHKYAMAVYQLAEAISKKRP